LNTISNVIQNNINIENLTDTFNSLVGNDTLAQFISEVRKCQTKGGENERIDKELAKIRLAFKDSSKLSLADKKKMCFKVTLYSYVRL